MYVYVIIVTCCKGETLHYELICQINCQLLGNQSGRYDH